MGPQQTTRLPPPVPLPPAPLSQQAQAPPSAPLLPWSTPVLTAVAAAMAVVVQWMVMRYPARVLWLRGWEGLVSAVVAGACLGLGVVLADRWLRSWPRALRWALGMSLRAFVPICWAQGIPYGHVPPPSEALEYALVEVVVTLPGCIVLGLMLGWAASARRGRVWWSMLTGFLAGLLVWLITTALYEARSLWLWNWRPLGAYLLPGLPFLPEHVAFGGLLGLALAMRLNAAERAHQEDGDR